MVILGVILVCVIIVCFFIGRNTAKGTNSYLNLKKRPAVAKGIVLSYIVFSGYFAFPISVDFTKLYLIVCAYGIIGLGFVKLYGMAKGKMVYLSSLGLTILGMGCRYILEYGEASNNYNFTIANVSLFIAIIPVYIVTVYCCGIKYSSKKIQK